MINLKELGRKAKTLARMVRRPRRIVDYVGLRVAFRMRWAKVPFLPTRLDIEPNNNCNLSCAHCQVTQWSKDTIHLGPERFEKIIDQFPGLTSIKLQGMGEPLLNKMLVEMLRIAEARDISAQFTTNGTVYTKKIADALASLRNTFVQVSIDGATADVFEDIRAGSKFAKVVENVRDMTARRAGSVATRVTVWTVMTQRNLHEIPDIVRLVKSLGVEHMSIQTFLGDWGKESMKAFVDPVRVDPESAAVRAKVQEAVAVAEEEGIALEVVGTNFFDKDRPCIWPWHSAYISSTGDVVPCCVLADSDTMKMGNLFDRPFKEIWNGPAYQTLRDQIARHDPPPACRACYRDVAPVMVAAEAPAAASEPAPEETLVQIRLKPREAAAPAETD
jgi:radical SAM protein with 4Fe4S-binding SPASM domain